MLGARRRGARGLGRGRPVHRLRAGPVRGGGRLVAVVRGRAGRARRRRRRGQRARRVHQFHLRRQLAGLGRRRPAGDRRPVRGPRVDHGVRRGRRAVGAAGASGPAQRAAALRADGRLPVAGYRAAVAAAVDRMRAGELDKAALAHDLLAVADAPLDPRFLLGGLARRYPSCWSFAVDGLVGATPELLRAAQRRDGLVAGAGRHGLVGGGPLRRTRDRTDSRGGCCRRRRTAASTRWPSSRSRPRCVRCAPSWTCPARPG